MPSAIEPSRREWRRASRSQRRTDDASSRALVPFLRTGRDCVLPPSFEGEPPASRLCRPHRASASARATSSKIAGASASKTAAGTVASSAKHAHTSNSAVTPTRSSTLMERSEARSTRSSTEPSSAPSPTEADRSRSSAP
eukprot:scaffold11828_cov63-Phaeocystis_antarctica.AAC.5